MKKIFLVGMPGSGKTTLGKLLAARIGYPFYDLDEIITAKTGKSINQIFEESGEAIFRDLETKNLRELIEQKEQFILATGGGTPCFNQNMELILNNGNSIFIKVSLEELVRRLKRKIAHRPLLKDKSESDLIKEIKEKLDVRKVFYEQSNYKVEGDTIGIEQIVDLLK